jgi:hypothetical protein
MPQLLMSELYWLQKTSKSESCYDWQPVSQYVLVSSSLWNLWPDIILSESCRVVSVGYPLLWEVGSVSCQSRQQYLAHCQKLNVIYIVHVTYFMYMQYILGLYQHRLSTADNPKTLVGYDTTAV